LLILFRETLFQETSEAVKLMIDVVNESNHFYIYDPSSSTFSITPSPENQNSFLKDLKNVFTTSSLTSSTPSNSSLLSSSNNIQNSSQIIRTSRREREFTNEEQTNNNQTNNQQQQSSTPYSSPITSGLY
jgi:hypothetical protein